MGRLQFIATALLVSAGLALAACGDGPDTPLSETPAIGPPGSVTPPPFPPALTATAAAANPSIPAGLTPVTVIPSPTSSVPGTPAAPKSGKKLDGGTTTASGLQFRDDRVGTGASPGPADTVKVHYVGTILDTGKVWYDSRAVGTPAEMPLNRVPPGFTEGITGMKVGGRRTLLIPAALGYRDAPIPDIPPNSDLLVDVELLEILK